MKICKYCDTPNDDDAAVCKSCGAWEFTWKCPQCGTEFDGGQFCPNCGLKPGTVPKACPVNKVPYDPPRPYSGCTAGEKGTASPDKNRRFWLWVLGWVFFFPIPLTVLILKTDRLKKSTKQILLVLLWTFLLLSAIFRH